MFNFKADKDDVIPNVPQWSKSNSYLNILFQPKKKRCNAALYTREEQQPFIISNGLFYCPATVWRSRQRVEMVHTMFAGLMKIQGLG